MFLHIVMNVLHSCISSSHGSMPVLYELWLLDKLLHAGQCHTVHGSTNTYVNMQWLCMSLHGQVHTSENALSRHGDFLLGKCTSKQNLSPPVPTGKTSVTWDRATLPCGFLT